MEKPGFSKAFTLSYTLKRKGALFMCGIAGLWSSTKVSSSVLQEKAEKMASSLEHRGPDGKGIWVDALNNLAFAHRRLKIIDLSEYAKQPMTSFKGEGVLTYNGEIYNFRQLQQDLEKAGVSFQSNSDSRVLLEALCFWGIEKTLPLLSGMFAFAFWDQDKKTLTLVRDRFGVKPLFWAKDPKSSSFFFASEIKAFQNVFPTFIINEEAVFQFFHQGYISSSHTIYENIYRVDPGTYLTISANGEVRTSSYWSSKKIIESGLRIRKNLSAINTHDLIEKGHSLLKKSVQKRLISDVPLGAFLSGGIDSSLVVALAQAASSNSLKTFSVGFSDASHNEASFAKEVAQHLGTSHTEITFIPEDLRSLLPLLPEIYDEPFADSSALPTLLVSQITKKEVSVALSGDGGDEVFGGYRRYLWANQYWPFLSKIPLPLRYLLAQGGEKIPSSIYQKINSFFPPTLQFQDKIIKGWAILKVSSIQDYYNALTQSICPFLNEEIIPHVTLSSLKDAKDLDLLQYWDTLSYLPDDILCKVDRATMSVGLEAREPLLDHDLFSYAWALPENLKIRHKETKWLLRQILQLYFPYHFFDRPKVGFGIPLDNWLRGPLYSWAHETFLTLSSLTRRFVDPEKVALFWEEHLSYHQNHGSLLWRVLMFDIWAKKWCPS